MLLHDLEEIVAKDAQHITSLTKSCLITILITSLLFYLYRALERNWITWIPEVGAIGVMQQV